MPLLGAGDSGSADVHAAKDGSRDDPSAGRGRFSLKWMKARSRTAWQWVETVVITLIAIGFGFWASPEDPFFIKAQFP